MKMDHTCLAWLHREKLWHFHKWLQVKNRYIHEGIIHN